MLSLTLRPCDNRIPIEADVVTPDQVVSLSLEEVRRLPVFQGNHQATLGEFFDVAGDASDGAIQIHGDCSTVKWIGTKMTSGRITIEGDVGMHLGSEMSGGSIEVLGNAGDWVGGEMKGGRILVRGNAGHLAGGAYRGSKVGMTGGEILIGGSVGNEVGGSMRRGLIAVGGACGDFVGVGMRAGTVLVYGEPGIRAGAGMKRGTIGLFGLNGREPDLLPTFRYACDYAPSILGVLVRHLRAAGFPVPESAFEVRTVRRYCGDYLESGKGEILAWAAA